MNGMYTYLNSAINCVISWIKDVCIRDLDNWNVRSPDKVIYQENKSITAKSTV